MCLYFLDSWTFTFFVLLLYNSLLEIALIQFTFECDELFMKINFTNTSFVFTKTRSANTFFDSLYSNIVSVKKKIQRSSCFKLFIFQRQIQKNRKSRKQWEQEEEKESVKSSDVYFPFVNPFSFSWPSLLDRLYCADQN